MTPARASEPPTGSASPADTVPLVVIGYGNPLREDDGVAWHVVETLVRAYPEWSRDSHCAHQLTPELAYIVSRADNVIFVDAGAGGLPGEVRCLRLDGQAEAHANSHAGSPQGLLSLARTVFGHCPTAHLLTIAGESFTHAETLTPTVSRAVPKAVALIVVLWQELTAGEPVEYRL